MEYQKELLAAVLHSGIPYTRVVCLSGQDYPLWSNNAIHRYFEEHQDTEFIGGFNLTLHRETAVAQDNPLPPFP